MLYSIYMMLRSICSADLCTAIYLNWDTNDDDDDDDDVAVSLAVNLNISSLPAGLSALEYTAASC
jgi:hypothetical protein